MKYKIRKQEEKSEEFVEVWLDDNFGRNATLWAKHSEHIQKWRILGIHPDGRIERFPALPQNLGFKTDSSGRVIIE